MATNEHSKILSGELEKAVNELADLAEEQKELEDTIKNLSRLRLDGSSKSGEQNDVTTVQNGLRARGARNFSSEEKKQRKRKASEPLPEASRGLWRKMFKVTPSPTPEGKSLSHQDFRSPRLHVLPESVPPSPVSSKPSIHSELGNYWQGCCGRVDPRSARFFATFFISVMMLGVCSTLFFIIDPCDSGPIWGVVGTIIGFWVDAPEIATAGSKRDKRRRDSE
jgi:hypothetical protein